jgi:hypothetical protein
MFLEILANEIINKFFWFYRFASKIILFQKIMQFKNAIQLCYSRQSVIKMIAEYHLLNLAHLPNGCG